MTTDSNIVPGGRVTGIPRSNSAGAQDAYEYGTITGVSATGRYKTYSVAFASRPIVNISAIRSAGSQNPLLYGTPNVGSFRIRMDSVGSTMLTYTAFGAR